MADLKTILTLVTRPFKQGLDEAEQHANSAMGNIERRAQRMNAAMGESNRRGSVSFQQAWQVAEKAITATTGALASGVALARAYAQEFDSARESVGRLDRAFAGLRSTIGGPIAMGLAGDGGGLLAGLTARLDELQGFLARPLDAAGRAEFAAAERTSRVQDLARRFAAEDDLARLALEAELAAQSGDRVGAAEAQGRLRRRQFQAGLSEARESALGLLDRPDLRGVVQPAVEAMLAALSARGELFDRLEEARLRAARSAVGLERVRQREGLVGQLDAAELGILQAEGRGDEARRRQVEDRFAQLAQALEGLDFLSEADRDTLGARIQDLRRRELQTIGRPELVGGVLGPGLAVPELVSQVFGGGARQEAEVARKQAADVKSIADMVRRIERKGFVAVLN